MASGISQAASAVAVSTVMCTGLPKSLIASGVGPPAPCLKLGGASTPRRRKFRKLRVVTWNMKSMTNEKLARIPRKRKVNMARVQET